MQQNAFLLYGANGYSGRLIARFAHQYGLQPILAGRNQQAISALANQLQLDYRIVDLDDKPALENVLREVNLVVHAAGPYDLTAKQMVAACMTTNTHYIDLNGDLEVFEMMQGYNQQAKEKNIMVLPGAGFDVVPTDCLSLWLKNRLPDANKLEIAFVIIGSGLSRGTSITTLQKLGMPGARRKDGQIIPEPIGIRGMWVEFPASKQKSFMMSIPWGDISTAYFSTGIPNIETYTGISKGVWLFLKFQWLFNRLLRTAFVHGIITKIINSKSPGPGDERRDKALSLVRATVTNPQGKSISATMRCPEAYSLTALTVLLIAKKILNGDYRPGYQTPASAYGEDLIMEIPGVEREMVAAV
ncbi:MAG TPA: saccharopine dehydrogenase NADP-binding domain-containing protein [Chitinophagaceae bacterium]|nr:saccharopine dehydrogenase NADP-binding domain-containing protein [Chitinophagaceae bacterium]